MYYFDKLKLYRLNAVTKQTVPISLSIPRKDLSECYIVKLGRDKLFLVSHQYAVIANIATDQIRRVKSMPTPKIYSGCIHFERKIYAFCGRLCEVPTRECCFFSLLSEDWSSLPKSIEPRQSLSPVLYKGAIILPNGCNSSVESFNPSTTEFCILPINTGLTESSTSFFHGDEIYILGLRKCSVWNLSTYQFVRQGEYKMINVAISQFPPFVHRNVGYFVYSGVVRKLDLDALVWVAS